MESKSIVKHREYNADYNRQRRVTEWQTKETLLFNYDSSGSSISDDEELPFLLSDESEQEFAYKSKETQRITNEEQLTYKSKETQKTIKRKRCTEDDESCHDHTSKSSSIPKPSLAQYITSPPGKVDDPPVAAATSTPVSNPTPPNRKVEKSGGYPCAVCRKGVGANSIQCSICRSWVHHGKKRCTRIKGPLPRKNSEIEKFVCIVCKGLEVQIQELKREVTSLKTLLVQQKQEILDAIKDKKIDDDPIEKLAVLFPHILTTEEELEELEIKLSEKSYRKSMVDVLASVFANRDPKAVIRGVMRHLMTPKLMGRYSLKGSRNNKKSLFYTRLHGLIHSVAKRFLPKQNKESEIIVKDCISNTLKFAPHGEGGDKFKPRKRYSAPDTMPNVDASDASPRASHLTPTVYKTQAVQVRAMSYMSDSD